MNSKSKKAYILSGLMQIAPGVYNILSDNRAFGFILLCSGMTFLCLALTKKK